MTGETTTAGGGSGPAGRPIRTLGVAAPGAMEVFTYEEGPLPDGQFRVATLYSGLSTGTELTFFRGTNPYLHNRWDAEYGVFRADEASLRLPLQSLGYMEVGRVTESRAAGVPVGAVVASVYGHRTGFTIDPAERFFLSLPPDLDPILGVYVAQMGPICANGILHAAGDLLGPNVTTLGDGVRGRHVLVVGGGVVGLLVGLFARHHGAAAVVVADQLPERLAVAGALGLDPLDIRAEEPWAALKARWRHGPGDRGADVAFHCSGVGAGLQAALKSLRPQGTVIDMAFYQGGLPEVRLGEEFHHNGLSIRCAQIGHVPPGLGRAWGRRRLALETLDLLRAHGDAVRRHLITDVVPFDDAPAFVADLAAGKRRTIQAVFRMAEGT